LLAVDGDGDLNLCHRFTGSELPTFGNVTSGIDGGAPLRLRGEGDRPRGHALRDLPHPQFMRRGCYHESYARFGDAHHRTYHYCDLLRRWVDFRSGHLRRYSAPQPEFFHPSPRAEECTRMSELKPTNHKADLLLEAVADGHVAEVLAMESVAGCSTTFDPGWEVDPFGGVAVALPAHGGGSLRLFRSLLVAAQVPDTMGTYPNWTPASLRPRATGATSTAYFPKNEQEREHVTVMDSRRLDWLRLGGLRRTDDIVERSARRRCG